MCSSDSQIGGSINHTLSHILIGWVIGRAAEGSPVRFQRQPIFVYFGQLSSLNFYQLAYGWQDRVRYSEHRCHVVPPRGASCGRKAVYSIQSWNLFRKKSFTIQVSTVSLITHYHSSNLIPPYHTSQNLTEWRLIFPINSDQFVVLQTLLDWNLNIIFVSSHIYQENSEWTQVIGSMNMEYDIYSTLPGIRTHNLLHPKCAPNPPYIEINK